jgi:hypothetical protein
MFADFFEEKKRDLAVSLLNESACCRGYSSISSCGLEGTLGLASGKNRF